MIKEAIPSTRPEPSKRTFRSKLLDAYIHRAQSRIKDPDVKTLFANCLTSTLDTTVFEYNLDDEQEDLAKARPKTWIITGDISAMWLRDSANQVAVYFPLLAKHRQTLMLEPECKRLYRLILGIIYVQASCVLLHPFSNAFVPPISTVEPSNSDWVRPPIPAKDSHRIWESKWELDSLASFVELSCKLVRASRRSDVFQNREWQSAMLVVLQVCRAQQRGTYEELELLEAAVDLDDSWEGRRGVYQFERRTTAASETRSLRGLGEPARRCGLIKSAFRPSDDATVFPFLIPANAMMATALVNLAILIETTVSSSECPPDDTVRRIAKESRELGNTVKEAVWRQGVVKIRREDNKEVSVFAYEVDGFGSYLLGDDANLPSLISLPLLGFVTPKDPTYQETRKMLLSSGNKWYFKGKVAEGIGGMHIGSNYIWPMSIITRAMTSDDDEEILDCIRTLKSTTAGTGQMHESFHCDDATNFTRS